MKSLAALITLVLAGSNAAWAGDVPKPDDFAYGMTFQSSKQASVYEAEIPLEVYRGTFRPDLGDLRVFDSAGKVVPHVVTPGGITEEDMTSQTDISVFPLREGTKQSQDALSVIVRRGDSDAQVNVPADESSAKKIVAYLLDASQVSSPIQSIRFDWVAPSETFLLQATLEASNDLKSWRTIVDDGVLAQFSLKNRGMTSKDVLVFPLVEAKYLRLRLSDQARIVPSFEINQAHVTFVTGQKSADREWTVVKATPFPNDPKSFSFDLGAELPVDRVELLLPDGNHAFQGEISSQAKIDDPAHPKTWRYSGLIYRLKEAGKNVTSGVITPGDAASRTPQRYWSLTINDDSAGFGQDLPSLKAGWVPEKIVFVAQGKGPYTLAFGSALIRKAQFDADSLLQLEGNKELQRGQATIEKQRDLGGPQRLIPPPPPPPSQKEIWGKRLALVGMIAATLLLGAMAYRLARQMTKEA